MVGTLGPAGVGGMGTGGMVGTGGMGTGGMIGTGGMGTGGMAGTGGMGTGGMAGTGGMGMTGGPCGSGTPTDGRPTSGPLACIVEEHNAVRAMVKSATPLPPVTWSADLATYAQQWTDMTCTSPRHRTSPSLNGQRLGENLYAGFGDTQSSSAGKQAVDGWAGEVACYTFGPFMSGDKCDMTCTSQMSSDGCGHYTQIVWRASVQIGCGVTTCGSGLSMQTEVICNYAPAGNFVGMNPY
ncbi:MAG: CAP domain-containing protein [Polyangiales bacterium]